MTYREAGTEDRSLLIVAATNRVVALKVNSGEIAWTWEPQSPSIRYNPRIEVHNGAVYVAMGSSVFGLVYQTGAQSFETTLDTWSATHAPTLLIEKNKLFVAVSNYVYALGLDGKLLWSICGRSNDSSMSLGLPDKVRHGDAVS